MPVYNRGKIIGQAIESALNQTHAHLELIICDNASTDNTQQVCEDYARKDSRVRYFRMPQNRGPIANFNETYRRASGAFFLWLGDDDWLDRNFIEACLRELLSQSDLVFVMGKVRYYFDDSSDPGFDALARDYVQNSGFWRVLRFVGSLKYVSQYYGIFRRDLFPAGQEVLRNCDGFDWLFMVDICLFGKARVLEDVIIHRRVRNTTSRADRIALLACLGYSPAEITKLMRFRNWYGAKAVYTHIAFESVACARMTSWHRHAIAFFIAIVYYVKNSLYSVWRVTEDIMLRVIGVERTQRIRNAVIQRVLGRQAKEPANQKTR